MYTWPLGKDKSSTEGAIQFVCSLVHPIPTGINDGAWTTVQSFFGAVVPPFLKSYRDCFYVYHAFRGKGTTTYATRSFVDFQFIFFLLFCFFCRPWPAGRLAFRASSVDGMENTRPPVTPLTINQKRRNMNTAHFSINLILDLVLIQLTIDVSNWQFNSLISVDLMRQFLVDRVDKRARGQSTCPHMGVVTDKFVGCCGRDDRGARQMALFFRSLSCRTLTEFSIFFFCCPSHAERASWSFLSFNVHLSRHHTWQLSNIPHNLDGHVVILEKEALPSGEKC